jgi:hypothetical protein
LSAIPSEIFVEVFLEWIKQLQWCIDMNGEFVRWTKSYQYIIINAIRWIELCYTRGGTPYTIQRDPVPLQNGSQSLSILFLFIWYKLQQSYSLNKGLWTA